MKVMATVAMVSRWGERAVSVTSCPQRTQLNNLARRRHAALDHYALKDRTLIKMATDKG